MVRLIADDGPAVALCELLGLPSSVFKLEVWRELGDMSLIERGESSTYCQVWTGAVKGAETSEPVE